MARIALGPEGRTRKGIAYARHPSEQIFLEADGDCHSYGANILAGIAPRLRFQVMDDGASVFPVVRNVADTSRFGAAWTAFVAQPEVTIRKQTVGNAASNRIARLDLSGTPRIIGIDKRPRHG